MDRLDQQFGLDKMSCPCDRSKGLRIDRDHSNCKLVLEELANFLDGEDYVKMQRQSRMSIYSVWSHCL